jgi:hypothetical protein
MNAYVYQSALLCEECTLIVCKDKTVPGKPVLLPVDLDTNTYDSDTYPKGPYPNGGGEVDRPQHCDHCGVFLENPLTADGYEYVKQSMSIATLRVPYPKETLSHSVWAPFYNL